MENKKFSNQKKKTKKKQKKKNHETPQVVIYREKPKANKQNQTQRKQIQMSAAAPSKQSPINKKAKVPIKEEVKGEHKEKEKKEKPVETKKRKREDDNKKDYAEAGVPNQNQNKRKLPQVKLKPLYYIDNERRDQIPWHLFEFEKPQVNKDRPSHAWAYYKIQNQFHPLRIFVKDVHLPMGFNDGYEKEEKNKPSLPCVHKNLRMTMIEGDAILQAKMEKCLGAAIPKQKLVEYWPMAKKDTVSDTGEKRDGLVVPTLEVDAVTGKLKPDKSGRIPFGMRSAESSEPLEAEEWRALVGENFKADIILRLKSVRRVGAKFGAKLVLELVRLHKNDSVQTVEFPTPEEEELMRKEIDQINNDSNEDQEEDQQDEKEGGELENNKNNGDEDNKKEEDGNKKEQEKNDKPKDADVVAEKEEDDDDEDAEE